MQSIETRPAETGTHGLVKLTGKVKHYKCIRAEANFFFTDADRNAMGATAVATALVGLSGPAMGTAISASSMEEQADYVEFELDGKPVKGWVWRSPFKEKDVVEVAAEWREDHYEVAGIARPSDKTIALYPHCSRAKTRHIKNAVKWWGMGAGGFLAFMFSVGAIMRWTSSHETISLVATLAYFFLMICYVVVGDIVNWPHNREIAFSIVLILMLGGGINIWIDGGISKFLEFAVYFLFGWYAICGWIAFRVSRKFMPFVRLSEKVFRTLGLPDPGNIDLVKSSKAQRKPDDPGEYGTFYFRY